METSHYEAEIRGFRAWRLKAGRMISPGAVAFMTEILLIFDTYNWPEVLEISTEMLALRLNVSKNTVINYRNELVDLKAINFDSSAGGKPGGYRVKSFADQEVKEKNEWKISPGLTGIMCVSQLLGVYWNDYAERKISKLIKQFGEKNVLVGMINNFQKKGSVNIDELARNAYFGGEFGREVFRETSQERDTDFNEGAVRAGNYDEGETSLNE